MLPSDPPAYYADKPTMRQRAGEAWAFVREVQAFCEAKTEQFLSRFGNPVVLKRFVYVGFVGILIYLVTSTGYFPQDDTKRAGSFSDRGMVNAFVDSNIDLRVMEQSLEYLSTMHHGVGTTGDLVQAQFIEQSFSRFGLKSLEVEKATGQVAFGNVSTLRVAGDELDLSAQYIPMSDDVDVEAGLVYAGHGSEDDLSGLDVDGKIVLVRFSTQVAMNRQIVNAKQRGARALLFAPGSDEHPDSFERPLNFYVETMPMVSLSSRQAQQVLGQLSGGKQFGAQAAGDGQLRAQLTIALHREQHRLWNVIGKIPGTEQVDKVLVVGSQRDSLCNGAVHPDSGMAVMLEMVDVLSRLSIEKNWKPLRSIYFVSFDGTEQNFVGAGKLLETNLFKMGFSYLNLGDVLGDELHVTANPLLNPCLDQYRAGHNFTLSNSFSQYRNYLPFIYDGVPAVDIGFQQDPAASQYPKFTCDDTFDYFSNHSVDPGFDKHRQMVSLATKVALSLVDDPLVPFDLVAFVEKLDEFYRDLQVYGKTMDPGNTLSYQPVITGMLRLKRLGYELNSWLKTWSDILNDNDGLEPSFLALHRWSWNSRMATFQKLFLQFDNLVFGPQRVEPLPTEKGERFEWWTFPTIRDAIAAQNWQEAQNKINELGELLSKAAVLFVQS